MLMTDDLDKNAKNASAKSKADIDFVDSLSKVTRGNISCSLIPPKKKGKQIASALFRVFIMLLCAAVFVYCVFTIADNLVGYAEAQDYYQKLAELWGQETDYTANPGGVLRYSQKDYSSVLKNQSCNSEIGGSASTVIPALPADSDEMMRIRAKLGALYRQNSDLMAWISIPGTVIDYPVVKTDNNDYYLNHSFNGDYLLAGTLFADYRNELDPEKNYNTIIYGHNLNLSSGTMFSILSNYFVKSYLDEHPDVYIYTNDGIYIYRIFNVAKVKANSGFIRTFFSSESDFISFAEQMASKSVHKDDSLTFTGNDRILTLSTCTNQHFASERYCIQAKLVEIRR